MRHAQLLALSCVLCCGILSAQTTPRNIPDTIILERFMLDPTQAMLPFPSGYDVDWVNYDMDGEPTYLGFPGNWYWESEINRDSSTTDNYGLMSISWLEKPSKLNLNWLILPLLEVPDPSYALYWRSASFEGPAFLDGYKVLVSENSNIPESGDFSTLLFEAASMIDKNDFCAGITPLNLNCYTFSNGYIHADGFTKSEYFETRYNDEAAVFSNYGFLEPHEVSLAAFAGKEIYIAFLHDAPIGNALQLDDIIVAKKTDIGTRDPEGSIAQFSVAPTLADEFVYLDWTLRERGGVRVWVSDARGRIVIDRQYEGELTELRHLPIGSLAPGIYVVTLQTNSGLAARKFVKR